MESLEQGLRGHGKSDQEIDELIERMRRA